MLILTLFLVFILLVGIISFLYYNRLIKAKNLVDEAFSGVDVQLKKRYDLIPSLIKLVQTYANYEFRSLVGITERRAGSLPTVEDTIAEDTLTSQELSSVQVQIEAYPNLKADEQFRKLMEELSLVENELVMSRRYYNGTARDYNIRTQQFPGFIIARLFQFKSLPFFEISDGNQRNIHSKD